MNKRELVAAIVEKSGLDREAAEAGLTATVEAISEALVSGDKVAIPGFGSFETRSRAARTGRNPQTGKPIAIAATSRPAFKAAAALKESVAKSLARSALRDQRGT